VNIVEILAMIFCHDSDLVPPNISSPRGVIYEHIEVSPEKLEVSGEHIMAEAGPLKLLKNFFGADEAITNYRPKISSWLATIIVVERDRETAWAKRCGVIDEIMKYFSIKNYIDTQPHSSFDSYQRREGL
jgi:pyrrolysine biosynthesis protein PylC